MRVTLSRREDVGELMAFIGQHWLKDHILARDEALLSWQFDQHRGSHQKFPGPSVLLGREKERIIGTLGLIPFQFNLRGKVIPGAWLSQWLVIPDARRGSAGLDLLRAAHNLGYEAIFGLGMNDAVMKVYSTLGFEILTELPRWVGVVALEETVGLLTDVSPRLDPAAAGHLCFRHLVDEDVAGEGQSNIVVEDWSGPFGEDWDQFWYSSLVPVLRCPARDSAYLNWRYVDHPTWTYRIQVARQVTTGEILGLCVARPEKIRDRAETVLRVVELLSTEIAQPCLARSITRMARSYGAAFADFYCSSESPARGLEALGFKKTDPDILWPTFPSRFQPLEPDAFTLKGAFWLSEDLRQDTGRLIGMDDFYITKADGDQDRPS